MESKVQAQHPDPAGQKERDLSKALSIDGWLSREEAELLYGMAGNADGPIVEIGSWQGRSTACLGLGSKAGRRSVVYAVDNFMGEPEASHKTTLGTDPADIVWIGPNTLKKNLSSVGLNGEVKVIPKASHMALEDLPSSFSLIFLDGAHDYDSVYRDLNLYLPRLAVGGFLVMHDATPADKGVCKAVEDRISNNPNSYRILDRVGSALVIRKVDTPRRVVALACPGGSFCWGTVAGIVQSTLGAHQIDCDNNANGWDDFNAMWARALNRAEAGEITHFAMLHSDMAPQAGWVDILMDEMEELQPTRIDWKATPSGPDIKFTGCDLISVACPLKDGRGVLSCGWGNPTNPWGAFRRLTVRELAKMPPTFSIEQTQYPDKYLLHNTGCWLADLRSPVFTQTDTDGYLRAWFDFPTRIRRDGNKWVHMRKSEDWFWSRKLHELGAKTFITRKVRLQHIGWSGFSNQGDWGTFTEGDSDTKPLWSKEEKCPTPT